MKIGLCTGLDNAAMAAELGFDYIEPPVNGIADLSDDEFSAKLKYVKEAGIETPVFNLLFPFSFTLYSAREEEVVAYLDRAMSRVQALGGKIAGFGSAKSRNRPDDMTFREAFRRLARITYITAETAAKYGVSIAIEPLNRSETNMINSMAEGAALIAASGSENVHLLSDYYHVATDGEPFHDIIRVGGVVHAHIASVYGRRFPLDASKEDFAGFLSVLRESGYDARLSVEGATDNLAEDGPAALALLRRLWQAS